MKKLKWMPLAIVILLSLLVIACTPDREAPAEIDSDSGEGQTEKPEELTIWTNDQEEQLEAIEKIAADFGEQEGIQVNVVPVPMLDQVQELSLAGPEGHGPDLYYQPHDQIGNIVAQGLAEPLDLSDGEISKFSDAAIEAVSYDFEGEVDIYGIPAVFETYGIFYNRDILPEAPETIDDLKAALEEHSDVSEDLFGFLMRSDDLYFAYPFFSNYGGYIFGGDVGEYDTSDIGLNNKGAVEGAELFQSFFGNGLIPTSTTTDVIDGLFTEGKVGAVINGPWSIPSYKDAIGDSLEFVAFPEINGEPGSTLVGVKSWMVSYYSERKDWAKELALFITNEENSNLYFEVAGELPANTDALKGIEDPIYSAFAEQIEYGVPMPSIPEMAHVWEPMNNALQFLAEGEEAQEILDEAVGHIESSIQSSSQ